MVAEEPNVMLDGKYSIKDAARLLGVSVRTFYNIRYSGLIKTSYGRTKKPFFKGRDILTYWRTA